MVKAILAAVITFIVGYLGMLCSKELSASDSLQNRHIPEI